MLRAVSEPAHLSATRAGYDAMAEQYAELFRTALDDAPLDRALLSAFAEMVRRDHLDPQLLEVGSGPGHVAGYLHQLGMAVGGIDLSHAMVALARREHPEVSFEVGEMGALDVADASLAGVVAWYSVIHVPASGRRAVIGEFHRVLRPGGYALLAFQVGGDTLHLDEAFGREVSLDFHRLQPNAVVALLDDAGFDLIARLVRAPDLSSAAAKIPQGFLIARKPCSPEDPHGGYTL
jgi:ubiquinone/menaquinone biosynthesis C-methylase UbiE